MARFERDPGTEPPPVPGTASSRPEQHADDDTGQGQPATPARDRFVRDTLARLTPRWARRLASRALGLVHPEVRRRVREAWRIGRFVLAGLMVTLLAVALIDTLTDLADDPPKSVVELMDRVQKPGVGVQWTVETVRDSRPDGERLHLESLRGNAVNLATGAFQGQFDGVIEERVRLSGTGKAAFVKIGDGAVGYFGCRDNGCPAASQRTGRSRPYPAMRALTPLLPADVAKAAGDITSVEATVIGRKGYTFTWKPNRQMLLRMLQADLLADAGVAAEQDVAAIRSGRYRLLYAVGSATAKPARMRSLQAAVRLDSGATLTILATYRGYDVAVSPNGG